MNRCNWTQNNSLMNKYHDEEWGVPVHDDNLLFEYLVLDTFQAGLSWKTILNKRENFRKAFDNFNFNTISAYTDLKINELLNDKSIIRNRLKIKATITNAIAFIRIQKEYGSFDKYIWQFVNYSTIINHWEQLTDIPVKTKESDNMSKDLRFDCDLIHVPFFHQDKKYNQNQEIKEYYDNGYNEIIVSDNYNIKETSPDIAFFLKPYDLIPKRFYIDEIKKVISKIIYIPYGMEIGSTSESMRYQYQLPLHDEAWFCVSYSKEHFKRACKYSKSKGTNFKFIGHPRMDLVDVDLSNNPEYIKIKNLSKGRKIIMWNPHFTIGKGDNWGSFKEYGLDILKYFSKLLAISLYSLSNCSLIIISSSLITSSNEEIALVKSSTWLVKKSKRSFVSSYSFST